MDATLAKVLRAWELSTPLHQPRPAVSAEDIAQAERQLDRRLPAAFKQLYATAGGGSFLHGNLMMEPPLPPAGTDGDTALTTASALMREAE